MRAVGPGRAVVPGALAVLFLLMPAALFARAMMMGLNHDEHQFIAAGWLHAHLQLLPYRDFPFFHMPLSMVVDGWLFSLADHLLLAARAASAAWAWLGLAAIFGFGLVVWRREPPARRMLLALAPSALLFVNPVFTYTYYLAWNQALATLLTILAVGSQCRGASRGSLGWFAASGVLLALAIGTRLSFAPLGLPFLVAACFFRGGGLRAALAFGAGLALGFLPSAFFIAQAPAAFFFDNFAYNGPVNAAFRGEAAHFWPALGSKILFLLQTLVLPANLLLASAFLYLHWHGDSRSHLGKLVLALLPFALLGALSATPSYTQYYYPVVTLVALGILAGLLENRSNVRRFRLGSWLALVALVVGSITALIDYRGILWLGQGERWVPLRTHSLGLALRDATPPGPILTLAPLFPLEGGRAIYPALATGPFAWRTTPFLTADQRARYGFVGEPELAAHLAQHPPAALLTGAEKGEKPFVHYAKQHGYHRLDLPDNLELWIAPAGHQALPVELKNGR